MIRNRIRTNHLSWLYGDRAKTWDNLNSWIYGDKYKRFNRTAQKAVETLIPSLPMAEEMARLDGRSPPEMPFFGNILIESMRRSLVSEALNQNLTEKEFETLIQRIKSVFLPAFKGLAQASFEELARLSESETLITLLNRLPLAQLTESERQQLKTNTFSSPEERDRLLEKKDREYFLRLEIQYEAQKIRGILQLSSALFWDRQFRQDLGVAAGQQLRPDQERSWKQGFSGSTRKRWKFNVCPWLNSFSDNNKG